MVWTWHSLADLPQPNDVLWCRFPHRPKLHLPADPAHPVVVREIERNDKRGEAILHVTYGTSNLKRWRELLDLIVEDPDEMRLAGLHEPTRFDLQDDLNKLPCFWCVEFFPDISRRGRLNQDCIRRMGNRLRWRSLGTQKSPVS
jgi:hypothetical protein